MVFNIFKKFNSLYNYEIILKEYEQRKEIERRFKNVLMEKKLWLKN